MSIVKRNGINFRELVLVDKIKGTGALPVHKSNIILVFCPKKTKFGSKTESKLKLK